MTVKCFFLKNSNSNFLNQISKVYYIVLKIYSFKVCCKDYVEINIISLLINKKSVNKC